MDDDITNISDDHNFSHRPLLQLRENPELNHLPILTKPGYYTVPSVDRMKVMTVEELSSVKSFTIGCISKGSVEFLSPINVMNLNLDETVIVNSHSIELYPDESTKPPRGQGLNIPALLTIYDCWARDKQNGGYKKDEQSCLIYENILKQKSLNMGVEFMSYSPVDGAWVFRVEGW